MEEQFLREYEKLCQKYKMGIGACGCCDSPYLHTTNMEIDGIIYDKTLDNITIGYLGSKTIDEYFKTTLDWDRAITHCIEMKNHAEDIGPYGMFYVMSCKEYLERFENGERTEELYNSMINLS